MDIYPGYKKRIRKTILGYIAKLLRLHIKIDSLPYGYDGLKYDKLQGIESETSN